MDPENQDIRIISVNKEAIKPSSDKKGFWVVPLKLSLKPEQSWESKFYEAQQKDTNVMKRKARIVEDFLNVEVSSADDLQKVLDVIKAEVTHANALCEEDYQKKLKIRRDLEDLRQRETDITHKFKEDSDKLQF